MPVSTLRFSSAFKDEQDQGIPVLVHKLKSGEQTYHELKAIYEKRAHIERQYGQQLLELSQLALGEQELGTLYASMETIPLAFEATARAHLDMADQLLHALTSPLVSFMKDQLDVILAQSQQIDQSQQLKCLHQAHVKKLQNAVDEAKENLARKQQANESIEIAQTALAQADQQLVAATETLDEVVHKFDDDWRSSCDIYQDLEERRINFIRSNLWAFANMMSSVYIVDDRGCENMRMGLEKTIVSMDIEEIIRRFGTCKGAIDNAYPSPISASSPPKPDPVSTAFEELETLLGTSSSSLPPPSATSIKSAESVYSQAHRRSIITSPSTSILPSTPQHEQQVISSPASIHSTTPSVISESHRSSTASSTVSAMAAASALAARPDLPTMSPAPPVHSVPIATTSTIESPGSQHQLSITTNVATMKPSSYHPKVPASSTPIQQTAVDPALVPVNSAPYHSTSASSSSVQMVEPPSYPANAATTATQAQPMHWNVPSATPHPPYTLTSAFQTPASLASTHPASTLASIGSPTSSPLPDDSQSTLQTASRQRQQRAPKPREEKWTFSTSKRASNAPPANGSHLPPHDPSQYPVLASSKLKSNYLDPSLHPPPNPASHDQPKLPIYRNSYIGSTSSLTMEVAPPISQPPKQRPMSSYIPARTQYVDPTTVKKDLPSSSSQPSLAIASSNNSSAVSLNKPDFLPAPAATAHPQPQHQGIRPPNWGDRQEMTTDPKHHQDMDGYLHGNGPHDEKNATVTASATPAQMGLQRFGSVSGPRQPPSNSNIMPSDLPQDDQPVNQDISQQPPEQTTATVATGSKGFFSSLFKRDGANSPSQDDGHRLPDGTEYQHKARAMWPYDAAIDTELSFKSNDVLAVIEKQTDGWWKAEILDNERRARGLVPGNYMQAIM